VRKKARDKERERERLRLTLLNQHARCFDAFVVITTWLKLFGKAEPKTKLTPFQLPPVVARADFAFQMGRERVRSWQRERERRMERERDSLRTAIAVVACLIGMLNKLRSTRSTRRIRQTKRQTIGQSDSRQ